MMSSRNISEWAFGTELRMKMRAREEFWTNIFYELSKP
jgi:hypothetical protein